MSTTWIIAYIIGGIIVAGLAFYLGRLLMQIKQVEQQKRQQVTERNNKLGSDIYTIAWAMRDGQCEYSEGCIRLWVLLDHYVETTPQDKEKQYPGIFSLYDKIKDMPTHQARKEQGKLERLKMDAARLGFEQDLEPLIKTDVEQLITRFKTYAQSN